MESLDPEFTGILEILGKITEQILRHRATDCPLGAAVNYRLPSRTRSK